MGLGRQKVRRTKSEQYQPATVVRKKLNTFAKHTSSDWSQMWSWGRGHKTNILGITWKSKAKQIYIYQIWKLNLLQIKSKKKKNFVQTIGQTDCAPFI